MNDLSTKKKVSWRGVVCVLFLPPFVFYGFLLIVGIIDDGWDALPSIREVFSGIGFYLAYAVLCGVGEIIWPVVLLVAIIFFGIALWRQNYDNYVQACWLYAVFWIGPMAFFNYCGP